MKRLIDRMTDFLISLVFIILLIFILLMYPFGNATFEKGVHDKREDRPTMEEVDNLLNELTSGISSEKDEFEVRKINVVYKRYRYDNLSDQEKLYLSNRINNSSKWIRYDHGKDGIRDSFYYCYNQFELIFTKGVEPNVGDKESLDNAFSVSIGWQDTDSACRRRFLALRGLVWTIDIPAGVVHNKKAEIKFLRR
ncbi:hypothetical protein [Moraxella porci]|uniref:hypothetical protein n=1 Tax=Moraxella porci TaxID=1288392 RepID=UPI0024490B4A|nr:hypothetical protein [Moraxella porci]MDH2274524.1 hypothetical protein [Moraxella porci]